MTDLAIARGDSRTYPFTITVGGVAKDLTGATVRFTAKRDLSDTDAAAQIRKSTATSGVAITDAEAGTCAVTILPADTSTLPPRTIQLWWDLELTESNGTVTTVASGTLQVTPDVTRGA